MVTLLQQIRLATLWNQEGRRIKLTRIYWARAVGAKKSPRKRLSHPHPVGWALYVWYHDTWKGYRKAKAAYHYPWHHYRKDRKSYTIKMKPGTDLFHPANLLFKKGV